MVLDLPVEGQRRNYSNNCPCAAVSGSNPNSFIGQSYYCESGSKQHAIGSTYFKADSLWDGADCPNDKSCCDTPTYICLRTIYSSKGRWIVLRTMDDIEVRICTLSVMKVY